MTHISNPSQTKHTKKRSSRTYRMIGISGVILACIIGTFIISYFGLMHQSLRLDEAQSMWQTSHSIGDTLHVVAQDVHVPLYHVILHFWQLYFGHSVITVRLLSFVFFAITIPLVYILGRQILRTGWALFATVIFSPRKWCPCNASSL